MQQRFCLHRRRVFGHCLSSIFRLRRSASPGRIRAVRAMRDAMDRLSVAEASAARDGQGREGGLPVSLSSLLFSFFLSKSNRCLIFGRSVGSVDDGIVLSALNSGR